MSTKTGILSMQKVINYGSVLQAYALKKLLLNAGAESVDFIDIRPGRILDEYKGQGRINQLLARKPFRHPVRFIKDLLYSRRYHLSVKAGWSWLGIASGAVDESEVDMAVIGSDEVFNVCQPTSWGFSRQLYGDIKGPRRIVSYAGSFGNTTLADIKRLDIADEIASCMSNLDEISVRDVNSACIVESLLGRKPALHIDPVLAYGFKKEIDSIAKKQKKQKKQKKHNYMVVYSYHRRINDKAEIDAIRKFARSKGLLLVSVMCRYDWCDAYADVESPLDVLNWFKNADYVVTDTFHGTIFSIITHSRFATLVRQSNRNKLTSLLEVAGLADRAAGPDTLPRILDTEIDYQSVEDTLNPHRAATADYLARQICSIS